MEQFNNPIKKNRCNLWLAAIVILPILAGGGYFGAVLWMERKAAALLDKTLATLPDGFRYRRGEITVNPWLSRVSLSSLLIESASNESYAAGSMDMDVSYGLLGSLLGGRLDLAQPTESAVETLKQIRIHDFSIGQDKSKSIQGAYSEIKDATLNLSALARLSTASSSLPEELAFDIARALEFDHLTIAGLTIFDNGTEKVKLERLTLDEMRKGVIKEAVLLGLNAAQGVQLGKVAVSGIQLEPGFVRMLTDLRAGIPDKLSSLQLMGKPTQPLAEMASLENLIVPTKEGRSVKLARFEVQSKFSPNLEQHDVTLRFDGLAIPVSDIPVKEVAQFLQRAGYSELNFKGRVNQNTHFKTGDVKTEPLELDGDRLGGLTLSSHIKGFDAFTQHSTPEALFGQFQNVTLVSMKITFVDLGMTNRFIDGLAKDSGQAEALRAQMIAGLTLLASARDVSRSIIGIEQMAENLRSFIQKPGQLTVSLIPKEPTPLPLLLLLLRQPSVEIGRIESQYYPPN